MSTISEGLAQISNTLVYSSMLVYTGALGAYVAELGHRDALRPERVDAGRRLVGVGGSDGIDGIDGPDAIGSDASGATELAVAAGRRTRAAGIALALTWLAFVLHLAAVVARAAAVQRAPWGNMFEFATAGAVVVTGVYLVVLHRRRDLSFLGTFVVGPVLLTLGLAVTVFYTEAAELVPALQSVWLLIHVSVAFIASALFTLGFSATVLQLAQERRESARAAGVTPGRGRFLDGLPAAVDLERLAYRMHVAAFPLWGFTLVAGAIWAEYAWGRYWNWDPKETWTFIIWIVYAAYLHARATRGWDGRRAAYLAIAGYLCLLANFLLVNFFAVGLHSYA